MRRVIIDTDPGVDDAAAILFALASPELQVEAITTIFGNGTVEQSTRNALFLLETAGRADIPVFKGAAKPLLREAEYSHHVHGNDALGGIGAPEPQGVSRLEHAAREIVDRVMRSPGEITLIALGPLTNVALAFCLEPRLAEVVHELILMGGAVHTSGNASEVASANLYKDPESAAIVYESSTRRVQVGLNVCDKTRVLREHRDRIAAASIPTTNLLTQITPHLADFYQRRRGAPAGAVGYNDVPSIGFALAPDLFQAQKYAVRISTRDELTKGQTVADVTGHWGRPPNTTVLMDVDAGRLVELFVERVVGYRPIT